MPHPQYVRLATNGAATASLVLGIIAVAVAVFFGWIPALGVVFTFFWATPGVITGIVGLNKANNEPVGGRSRAIWGLSLSGGSILIALMWMGFLASLFSIES